MGTRAASARPPPAGAPRDGAPRQPQARPPTKAIPRLKVKFTGLTQTLGPL
jgi:hypothetical protein